MTRGSDWRGLAAVAFCVLSAGASPALPDDRQLTAVPSAEMRRLRLAAEQQNPDAQYQLGLVYATEGVGQDFVAAAQWLRKAADQGHAKAQNDLAVLYEEGRGVPQDFLMAVEWWRRAADQGLADAQNYLGVMYDNGTGVGRDPEQAFAWYRRSAEQGHAAAQNNLGLMYEIGRGTSLNYSEALTWYRRSAEQGWAQAMANLALLYVGGVGVEPDLIEADKWLRIAAERAEGDDQVRYNSLREALERKIDADDFAEAWQRARDWIRAFEQHRH